MARLADTAVVFTGCHTGPVEVTVELHDTMPIPLVDGWDDAVELTLTTRAGEVAVVDWAGGDGDSSARSRSRPAPG